MADSGLDGTLEGYRETLAAHGPGCCYLSEQAGRLLAAVEAVLKVTDPLENETLGGMFMAALHLQVRAAISRALLGEEGSDHA